MDHTRKALQNPDPHPLDPLTGEELQQAIGIIRRERGLDPRALFAQVRLKEPGKATVREFRHGDVIQREGRLKSWQHLVGVQPCILPAESAEMARAVKSHPDFIHGLRRRDIHDADRVTVEAFPVANLGEPEEKHLRDTRAHCFYAEKPGDNAYARPIEGLVPVVDLDAMAVLRIEDHGVIPLPPDPGDYRADRLTPEPPLAELQITQPGGAGFTVRGNQVKWQNWRFRVGFTPKEGLVLQTLSFQDGIHDRPLVYRASLSELVVPYGDTAGDHNMNHSFDLGETIFGKQVNSLKLGCDCLGEIYYFDFDQGDILKTNDDMLPLFHSHLEMEFLHYSF